MRSLPTHWSLETILQVATAGSLALCVLVWLAKVIMSNVSAPQYQGPARKLAPGTHVYTPETAAHGFNVLIDTGPGISFPIEFLARI